MEILTAKLAKDLQSDSLDYVEIRAELVRIYNQHHGTRLSTQEGISEDEYISLIRWIRQTDYGTFLSICRRIDKSSSVAIYSLTLSEKISSLAQFHCPICGVSFPVSIIPIRIQPLSYQSSPARLHNAFKRAIAFRLRRAQSEQSYFGKRLCVHTVFVTSLKLKEKDVDNMAKLFMDSLQGVLFENDKLVDHLSLMKIRHNEDEEYIFLNIRESKLNNHIDVLLPKLNHSWAGDEFLDLEQFMD
jgi:Holliday junction resolvase RusA-like endonuclease